MALVKDPKSNNLLFLKGHLLLKRKSNKLYFRATEK